MKVIALIGRILFSAIFIIKGLDHFTSGALAYAQKMGVPMPAFFVPVSGILAVLGGVSILIGYRARIGAWLLVIFLIPTTFMMHKFWQFQDSYHSLLNMYCFLKNLSMIGACLMLTYFGSGPYSVCKK